MTKEDFIKILTDRVQEYIESFDIFDSNPQLMINPVSLSVTLVNGSVMLDNIADSDETIEDAAGAEGDASESATDYQAKQNPDFYPVKKLLITMAGKATPDTKAIDAIADTYLA